MKFKEFIYSEDDELVGILFDNGDKIEHYHIADCCEYVYADWKSIDHSFFNSEFDEIKIEPCKRYGFTVNGYFVACYNQQNGYYSDNLSIIKTSKVLNKKRKLVEKIEQWNVNSLDID